MIEELRSHLRKTRGFTLVELLIVIAIIAILVLIVIVAINPVERLNETRDDRAASNVRSTGTLIGTCVTRMLAVGNAMTDCDTGGEVATNGQGNVPAGVAVNANVGVTNICAWQLGRTGHNFQYQHLTGEVADVGAVTACP